MTVTVLKEDSVLSLKRYKGRTVGEIIKENPEYLIWIHNNVNYLELSPEVLAKCYDAKPLPMFSFSLTELRKHREELSTLLQYKTNKDMMVPSARYAIELMQYLESTLSLKKDMTIYLNKED